MELSYSFHLNNDKNKSRRIKTSAKNNLSGTTSFSNNAIQNYQQLSKADRHNLRKYDKNIELIFTIKGTSSIVNDTQKLYLDLFEDARIKYNEKQTRSDRKIDNYFNHISNDNKHDLACEIIIELGDMFFWKDKEEDYKRKMIDVFKEQIVDLEKVVPNFKVANATIHFDESSPHLHIIGVPFKDGNKNGMEKQVGKSTIFTKESLSKIQDEMRLCCIKSFNKVYEVEYSLKAKELGKNEDINSKDMETYNQIKKKQKELKKQLDELNIKKDNLINKSNNIESKINNLKPTVLNKNNFTISNDDIKEIVSYIDNTKDTIKDLKTANQFTNILDNYEKDIINHNNLVKELNGEVNNKDKKIKKLETQSQTLKQENNKLQKENDEIKKAYEKLQELIAMIIKQIKRALRKLLEIGNEKTIEYASNETKIYYNHKLLDRNDVYDVAVDTSKEKELFNYASIHRNKKIEKENIISKEHTKSKDNEISL